MLNKIETLKGEFQRKLLVKLQRRDAEGKEIRKVDSLKNLCFCINLHEIQLFQFPLRRNFFQDS